MKINKEAYKKLINDDAKWIVENSEDCLERKHILEILWKSIECYYPTASQSVSPAYKESRECPGGVYYIEHLDAETVRLIPRR